MNELKTILNTIPEEMKKEIYNDALKPTMQETGKTLSLIPRVIKNAFAKVEMWCDKREFVVQKFKIELQKKLEKIEEENIVDADPSIFIPSVQAISYTWDKEEIKQLYLNLMASDMDKTAKDKVHPSFVEIIKQMSCTDVKIFTKLYKIDYYPVCSLFIKADEQYGANFVLEYLLPDSFYDFLSEKQVVESLNNLERLNLIKIDMNIKFIDKGNYENIKNCKIIQKYKEKFGEKLIIKKGVIKTTEYGKSFLDVCCK